MSDLQLFHGPNAGYVLDLFERYRQDPATVDEATRAFFAAWVEATGDGQPWLDAAPVAVSAGASAGAMVGEDGYDGRDGAAPPVPIENGAATASLLQTATNGVGAAPVSSDQAPVPAGDWPCSIPQIVGAARLVRFIRERGHLGARVDPLGSELPGDPGLELATHGLTREILAAMPPIVVQSRLAEGASSALEAIERLYRVYSGAIGYDDDHIQIDEERQWIRGAAESGRFWQGFDADYKRELLERITAVEAFERFIHQTFLGQKRFSIEGNDILVPMLDSIIQHAATAGTHEVVMGMAHRGRLNVLTHTLGKPYSAILAEFQGPNNYHRGTYLGWTGDVKYHLGARRAYVEGGVYEMPITLVPNPSHLEFVNPVVEGRARAAQERRNEPGEPHKDSTASLPILIHGDASFTGQGVVSETLNLSRLQGYHTGGTIHIIINNQIGFTTDTHDARSTLYASDLSKGFEIPVIHVNADNPLACIAAARMAWAYREAFGKDFMIDLIGYRRWGHNEGDEPTYTQPVMYSQIANHPTVREIWAAELVREGVVTEAEVVAIQQQARERLQRAQHEVVTRGRIEAAVAVSAASLLRRPVSDPQNLSAEQLIELNEALLERPASFMLHPRLERPLQRRRTAIHEVAGIDWAHAEALAFAAILAEGTPVRLTGQDSERGTFSQRHVALRDYTTGERYVPLQALPQARASFAVYNSPLSENATLGFEYGFSIHAPETLVIWEGQFGDFANGAQVIIDQFLVSGYAKWGQQPALVLLLPHGYEGQGPDHSSARIERYMQLAADNNIRIVNCTTAAQYYHLLRRQAMLLHADPRPLVVMTPKSLLRHPLAASSLDELATGRFQPVLAPKLERGAAQAVRRLILCSGKVYADLMGKWGGNGTSSLPEHVAVARVEELFPFPASDLEHLIRSCPGLREIVWLQEEPRNMGAWNSGVRPRMQELLDGLRPVPEQPIQLFFCGRAESASTAEGTHSQHEVEQNRIVREAVQGTFERPVA